MMTSEVLCSYFPGPLQLPISSSQPTHVTVAAELEPEHPPPPPPSQQLWDHPLTSSSSAPLLHGPVAVAEKANAATAAAVAASASGVGGVPPAPGIQMKFVENLIKDSQEELW